MRVAIIFNKDFNSVINVFGMQNKEVYNPNTVSKVADALEKGGHNVEIIDGNMEVIENIKSFLPKVQDGERFGIVFNMAYGIQGESRYTHIPSMLEMVGIPYVGSSPSGHALALDKVITKMILQRHKIPTPDFWVFSSNEEDMSHVQYPAIVKPKVESVSFGLKVVNNETELQEAIEFIITEFKQQALVEKFIRGREFAIGVLGNDPIEVFPVLEIDLEGDPNAIQTAEDKQKKPKVKICPADISDDLSIEMQELSIRVFKALGLKDFARVDIRLSEDDEIHILEVNSMASLGGTGSYVTAAKAKGYDFTSLVNKMLEVAAMRYFRNDITLSNYTLDDKMMPLSTKIRTYLRTRQEFIEKFLEQTVNINTYVKNIDGVNSFGNIIRKQLSALGFTGEVFSQNQVGNILFFTNSELGDYDYLLIGNLDNSTKLNKYKYFKGSDHKLYGSGIWEHKSGIGILLLTLQTLKYLRILKKFKIGIMLTTDDSLQGSFSKSIISDKSNKAKYVFGLHGAFLDGGMVTSRSGSAVYNFNMNLKSYESAIDVTKGVNVFSKLISDWVSLSSEEKGVILSPKDSYMTSNITEPYFHGEATMSVKFNDSELFKEIDKKIRKLIPRNKYKNLFDFQIEGGEKRPAQVHTDKTDYIMSIIKQLAEGLDIRLKGEHRWSSADISFVNKDKYILDGFGPAGIKEFNGMEYVLKHNILEKSLLLTVLLNELNKDNK